MKATARALAAILACPVLAAADPVPLGPDFVVNGNPFPGAQQVNPGACRAPAGQFVIVWYGDSVSGPTSSGSASRAPGRATGPSS